jgi:hypothetical protein
LVTGDMVIGESLVRGGAQFTPLKHYEDMLNAGTVELRVLVPTASTILDQNYAAAWWTEHVLNTPYDLLAIPRLLFKAWFRDWSHAAAGLTWANWCTEGWANAYKAAHCDVWHNKNPTPYTTEKREREGKFTDVTRMVITEEINEEQAEHVRGNCPGNLSRATA